MCIFWVGDLRAKKCWQVKIRKGWRKDRTVRIKEIEFESSNLIMKQKLNSYKLSEKQLVYTSTAFFFHKNKITVKYDPIPAIIVIMVTLNQLNNSNKWNTIFSQFKEIRGISFEYLILQKKFVFQTSNQKIKVMLTYNNLAKRHQQLSISLQERKESLLIHHSMTQSNQIQLLLIERYLNEMNNYRLTKTDLLLFNQAQLKHKAENQFEVRRRQSKIGQLRYLLICKEDELQWQISKGKSISGMSAHKENLLSFNQEITLFIKLIHQFKEKNDLENQIKRLSQSLKIGDQKKSHFFSKQLIKHSHIQQLVVESQKQRQLQIQYSKLQKEYAEIGQLHSQLVNKYKQLSVVQSSAIVIDEQCSNISSWKTICSTSSEQSI